MKHLVFTLLAALLVSGAASAQRLMVGVRGGVNFTDYSFVPTRIGDIRFSPGSPRAGYDVGFVLRLNLSKHLHLQSELDYAFVNYSVRAGDAGNRRLTLRTERFEIPVQLGFQFGVLRLFGGALFRVTDSERSSAPQLLRVRFNNGDIGVMGGLGFNVRKFFIDFRISGYPRSRVWHDFTSDGVSRRVKVPHDIVYGGSVGFFFWKNPSRPPPPAGARTARRGGPARPPHARQYRRLGLLARHRVFHADVARPCAHAQIAHARIAHRRQHPDVRHPYLSIRCARQRAHPGHPAHKVHRLRGGHGLRRGTDALRANAVVRAEHQNGAPSRGLRDLPVYAGQAHGVAFQIAQTPRRLYQGVQPGLRRRHGRLVQRRNA